jgi:hypothetical protein
MQDKSTDRDDDGRYDDNPQDDHEHHPGDPHATHVVAESSHSGAAPITSHH